MYTEKKESANSAKREYVKPFAEVMKLEAFNSLLDWSAPKEQGPGAGEEVEIEAKEEDLFDGIKGHNLWED